MKKKYEQFIKFIRNTGVHSRRYGVLLLLILVSLNQYVTADEGIAKPTIHQTGCHPLTEKQIQDIKNNWPKILGVKPNKYGAARIQKHAEAMGLLQAHVDASSSEDEFITNKSSPSRIAAHQENLTTFSLPTSVDNSKLPCFPPIGNQGGQGSCAAWASTYYHATHEYGLLNGINNKTNSAGIRSPKWTYNMINDGTDSGSSPYYAYQLLSCNGAPANNDFPYNTNFTEWDLNTNHWISALSYRMGTAQYLNISGPQDIQTVKQILNNGHLVTCITFASSWNFTNIKADPSSTSNPYLNQNAIYWMNGQNGGHFITIVGYDDNIWIDVNGNGQVDSGERGAFLLANSWGPYWSNAGFVWVSYDAFYQMSAVANGPSVGRVPFGEELYSIIPKATNYSPKLVAKFTLTQAQREQLAMFTGISGTNVTAPANYTLSAALNRDGGALAFDGGSPRNMAATFVLDLTDFLSVNTTQRYYLGTTDTIAGNITTVNAFSLVDLVHTKEVVNTTTPLTVDASTINPYIDYNFPNNTPDTTPPVVTITSPSNGSTIKGSVDFNANATDNYGVSRVDFYVDSILIVSDTGAPYTVSIDTTKMANGNHTFTVIAYDGAGNSSTSSNTVTVYNIAPDKIPPVVSITSPLDGSTVSGTINLTANATDNIGVSRVDFYADSMLFATDTTAPYSVSLDTTKMANGNHTLSAVAYDIAGNGSSLSIIVHVSNSSSDTTPPVVSITTPPNGSTVSGTIGINASATDNVGVSRVDFYIDSTLFASDTTNPYTVALDTTTKTNGSHTIKAIAYDAAGNSSVSTVTVNVSNTVPDTMPPVVAITTPPNGSTVSGTIGINASATDNVGVSRVDFYIDSTLFASDTTNPYTVALDTTTKTNGSHTIKAIAYDAAGNSSVSTVTVNVSNSVPDTMPPVVAITTPPNGSTVSGTIGINASATDNVGVSRVDFYIDSTLFASDATNPYTVALDTTTKTNGSHIIKAIAYDAAGNSSVSTVTVNVSNTVPDTTPPVVSITTPPNGSTVSGTIGINASATDNVGVSRVDFYIDSTLFASDTTNPYTVALDTTTKTNGSHIIKAIAYDAAGNSSVSTVTVNVSNTVPDTTPPVVSITTPPNGSTVSGTIGINASATDNVGVSRVDFYIDSTLFASDTTNPYTVALDTTTKTNGSHTIKAVAYDAAGNSGVSTVTVNVSNTVPDTTPPVVSITTPPNGSTVSGTIGINASATDNVGVSRVDFYVDSTLFASDTTNPYTVALDTTTKTNGSHIIKAVAYDAAGNSSVSTVTVNVSNSVPDTMPPVVSITTPPNGSTVSGTIGINASATDNVGVSRVDFYIDSTLFATDAAAPYTVALDTTTKTNGSHIIKAVAYDAAGNSGVSTVTVNVSNIPDKMPPVVSFTTPLNGATVSGTIAVNAYAADNVGVSRVDFYVDSTLFASDATYPYTVALDTTKITNGNHIIKAVAYDAAGNSSVTTVTVNVTNGVSGTRPL